MYETKSSDILRLYETLISKREDATTTNLHALCLRVCSLADLHFLDWQACRLLKLCDVPVVLRVKEIAPAHLTSRVAAHIVFDNSEQSESQISNLESQIDSLTIYHHGMILHRFLDVRGWSDVWHEYLTSRDKTLPHVVAAGATLAARFPHLRSGLITGIDLFHQGSYYEAHEDWESLWMRLDANDERERVERRVVQGLIQLSGAHLHRLKSRPAQAGKLFNAASQHLIFARELAWIDVDKLLDESQNIFARCEAHSAAIDDLSFPSIPLRVTHKNIARKHL